MARLAFIFPGQGSQSFGMGLDIFNNSSVAKELLLKSSQALDINFQDLLFQENENLSISSFTQPAIVLNSLMSYLAFKERISLDPVYTLGHSLGEFSALSVSGALEFSDALKLVNLRGKFMQESVSKKEAGMAVILGLSDQVVEEISANLQKEGFELWPANYNCDGQIVVAGVKEDLIKAEEHFKNSGAKRFMLLNMSVASHCPLMQEASLKLTSELEKVLKDSFNPVISNVTAKEYSSKAKALKLLKEQLIKPVLYKQSIKNIDDEVDCYIEFGASVLKGINRKISSKPTYSVYDTASLEECVKFLELR